MIRQHISGNRIRLSIAAALCFYLSCLPLPVLSQSAGGFDIDDSDPIQLTSKIMEVHPEEGRLVVAEHSVWIVDFMLANGQQFKTALKNAAGNSIALGAFARRQMVRVQGFKLPDGRIIATRVQQIDRRETQIKHRFGTRSRRMKAVGPAQ